MVTVSKTTATGCSRTEEWVPLPPLQCNWVFHVLVFKLKSMNKSLTDGQVEWQILQTDGST